MKKGVIYARYSCDNQSEQSIEGQLHICRDYAKANGILIVDTYIDRAMTGTNDLRPDFRRMILDSAKHQWEIVLVYKLDRFSRNKYEATIHKHTLKENGVKLVSAMENIPDTPEGIILESLLEGMNQYYSAELKQKVNRGLRESWSKGKATGGVRIFGYDVIDKKYVVNEYESEIIHEAFSLYAQGSCVRDIAVLLKAKGYRRRNGEFLNTRYLYKILHTKVYTGRVERQGVVYDQLFPRIISDELWNAVEEIHDEKKHDVYNKKERFGYLLSGKLFCGECKHLMVGCGGTSGTGDVYYYYSCHKSSDRVKACKTRPIPKKYIEDLVIRATTEMLKDEAAIHRLAESVYSVHQKETEDFSQIKLLEKKLAATKKAQANVVKAIEQGIILDVTKNRLQELDQEITTIESEIEKEKARTYTYLSVEQIEAYFYKYVYEDVEDNAVRKMLVSAFVREVFLYPDKVVVTFNFTDRPPERVKPSQEYAKKIEGEIKAAENAPFSRNKSSQSNSAFAPPEA